jgi:transglutaminase superfamily protein
MAKLQKLLKRSPADLLLLIKVAGLLVIVDCGLRLLPLPRLQAILARRRWRWRTPQTVEERLLGRLVWAVDVSGWYGGASCLKKALTLQWLLSRRGVSSRLWLGVQPEEATLRAHAWLEHDGCVIIGRAMAEGYTPLHSFDGGDALAMNIGRYRETP